MKDALGNELHEGDLVMVQLQTPIFWGIITKIEEGSIVAITGTKDGRPQAGVQPAKVIVASNHTVAGIPNQPLGSVLALRDPGTIQIEKIPEGKSSELSN